MYAERQQKFMAQMDGGVAIFRAASMIGQCKYHPDSDFYYLTGFEEPDAVCLLAPHHKEHKFVLFVRPKNREREIWYGRRVGVEDAKEQFGADETYPIDKLDEHLPKYLDDVDKIYYRFGSDKEFNQKVVNLIQRYQFSQQRESKGPRAIIDAGEILHEMRLFKNPAELDMMRKAAEITAEAHIAAMKAAHPGIYEYELEALIDYTFRKNGALRPAFVTILASGPNTTILHYSTNNRQIQEQDLILIDAAAEYAHYSADVTRTFPTSGVFSDPQKAIYNIVLDAQLAAIEIAKPNTPYHDMHKIAVRTITAGLVRLGLLSGEVDKLIESEEYKKFYMHNAGHWLGMDSHDVGKYKVGGQSRPLQPGMTFTVEPGIYIAEDIDDVPSEYLNIGVRIEDNVLITDDGNEVLTAAIPKTIEDIERIMRER